MFNLTAGAMSKEKIDLVDVQKLDSSIVVDLKYASNENMFERPVYPENIAYLRKSTAEKLLNAQKKLQEQGFGLMIWDAYRPLSVQKLMWEINSDPKYVANPKTGSIHNRGGAVDVTLVDKNGKELPVPTGFDDFSVKAQADYSKLPEETIKNREILKKAMTSSGFSQYAKEWWHFTDTEAARFSVLNISFEDLAAITQTVKKINPNQAAGSTTLSIFEKKKIVFNLIDIKEGLIVLNPAASYKTQDKAATYQGIAAENKLQEFYLKIDPQNMVLFDEATYELIVLPASEFSQFYFFINDEPSLPRGKIFNMVGRITIKTDGLVLKSRGINWQEDGNIIKIKVFRWK